MSDAPGVSGGIELPCSGTRGLDDPSDRNAIVAYWVTQDTFTSVQLPWASLASIGPLVPTESLAVGEAR